MTTASNFSTFREQFPELAAQELPTGRVKITLADTDCDIFVEYYQVLNCRDGDDTWRYTLSHTTHNFQSSGPYSHPTQLGCWIAAKRYFVETRYLKIPEDNSHLCDATRHIVAQAQKKRSARAGVLYATPQTGDFSVDKSATFRRVCSTSKLDCQQTAALEHSYYTSSYGDCSYSGGLGASIPYARLSKSETPHPAIFWTFKKGRSGAGRGVDFWLNVTAWTLEGSSWVGGRMTP